MLCKQVCIQGVQGQENSRWHSRTRSRISRLLSNPQIIAFYSGFCGACSHWHFYLYNREESEMPTGLEETKHGMHFASPLL